MSFDNCQSEFCADKVNLKRKVSCLSVEAKPCFELWNSWFVWIYVWISLCVGVGGVVRLNECENDYVTDLETR